MSTHTRIGADATCCVGGNTAVAAVQAGVARGLFEDVWCRALPSRTSRGGSRETPRPAVEPRDDSDGARDAVDARSATARARGFVMSRHRYRTPHPRWGFTPPATRLQ